MCVATRWLAAGLAALWLCVCGGCGFAEESGFERLTAYCAENLQLTDEGWYAKGMHSFTGKDDYLLGVTEDRKTVILSCLASDRSAVVYGKLGADGNLDMRVRFRTDGEDVTGDVQLDAAQYRYGDRIEDFTYESDQRKWRYENFNLRASEYIRDTLLYMNCLIDQLDIGLQLSDVGFRACGESGFFAESIEPEEMAGIWQAEAADGTRYGCYLAGNESLDWTWTGGASPIDISNVEAHRDQMLASESLVASEYDPVIGVRFVQTELNFPGSGGRDVLRRVFRRDANGDLVMRTESCVYGLSAAMDGLQYVKVADAPEGVAVTNYQPTLGESNALRAAQSYLDFKGFSRSGLIDQLEYEGYAPSEAEYAVESCGADWNEQAARVAKSYLEFKAFSRSGLIDQLEYEGFSHEQAVYGVEQVGY